jgi:Transglycosylase SLT domain
MWAHRSEAVGWAILDGVTTPRETPEAPPPPAAEETVPAAESVPSTAAEKAAPRLRPAVAAVRAGQAAQAAGRMVATGGRTTLHAARRPPGRLVMGGLLITALVAATIALGTALVPTSGKPRADQPSPSAAGPSTVESVAASPSFTPLPTTTASAAPPNEGLTVWAERLGPKVEIPPVALRAYAYAEYVLSARKPACGLRWTTIAAIGKIESNHGRVGASSLGTDGRALPPIIGPALDGKGGRAKVTDTDAGALDNDRAWDHAVGPMQFLPATWRSYAIDADGDGIVDPNDIDDAALAVANKLCEANKDLSVAANWTAAIKTFTDLSAKVQDVFTAANTYGQKSRS